MKKDFIIHEYFKKVLDGMTILVQIDTKQLKGTEIIIYPSGEKEITAREFDEDIPSFTSH